MVEFNDPGIGPVRHTTSGTEFGNFFLNLNAYEGGDCPEYAMGGLKMALQASPHNSIIMVLTDASAKDYNDAILINEIKSLISVTQSQVIFMVTGLCSDTSDPAFTIFREIARLSFGHVYQLNLASLGSAFRYVGSVIARPAKSSLRLFSGDYESGSHSDSFAVPEKLTDLIMTTEGSISSLKVAGPDTRPVALRTVVSEKWGSMYRLRSPKKGSWKIDVTGEGPHSVRVEGLKVPSTALTTDCSKCHPNATCEDYDGTKICTCKEGFFGNGIRCSDEDECAYSWLNKCAEGTCINTIGSYTCSCSSGYIANEDHICVPIDYCAKPSTNKCHEYATCTHTGSGYTCACSSGFKGDGFDCKYSKCTDIASLDFVLKCNENEMKASFPACQLKHFGYAVNGVQLAGTRCTGVEDALGLVSVTSPLKEGECGNTVVNNGTHTTYRNRLFVAPNSEVVDATSLVFPVVKRFSCTYINKESA
ncbi:MGC89178 protein [Xenopus tropicalis]|uniref:MGC89178 protein n=1 Tax=Xenopus tropicalis TaxID=8364 RepID=A0A803KJI2_XENTR|eukprot:NP_001008097.1 MGC89178 protein [Xenopus tropicalis]